jgi:hypothetical protein
MLGQEYDTDFSAPAVAIAPPDSPNVESLGRKSIFERAKTITTAEFNRLSRDERKAMSIALAEMWNIPIPKRFTVKGMPYENENPLWYLRLTSGEMRGGAIFG